MDTASFHTADGIESDYPREYILKVWPLCILVSKKGGVAWTLIIKWSSIDYILGLVIYGSSDSHLPFYWSIQSAEYNGDDLSSRLLHQGAQYFSATEGDSDSDADDRGTLRADQYVGDPDQPKLALAEDSIPPGPPASEKQPPPQDDEYRGKRVNLTKYYSLIPTK